MVPCKHIPVIHAIAACIHYLSREWKLLIVLWSLAIWLGPTQ